jgi:hypothetical protein
MTNEYAAIFDEKPKISQVSPSIAEMQRFCEGITQRTQPIGHCRLERGYVVAYGQEFRVTLIRTDNQIKIVLLRAYIPLQDFPVLLDTYAQEMITCQNLTELKKELAEFLRMEYVQEQIREWLR